MRQSRTTATTRNKSATSPGGVAAKGGGGPRMPGGAKKVRKRRAIAGVMMLTINSVISRLCASGCRILTIANVKKTAMSGHAVSVTAEKRSAASP